MSAVQVCGVPSLVVVTGASRGIGRGLTTKLAENVGSGSYFILIARTETDLSDTATMVSNYSKTSRKSLDVCCVSVDLSQEESSDIIAKELSKLDQAKYQHFILMLNAGSLGDVDRWAHQFSDVTRLQGYFHLNLLSMITLISNFLEIFKPDVTRRNTIVNISTLSAIQPTKGAALYCCSKAARYMYMKVLAEEQKGRVRVLNYSPGPVKTEMYTEYVTKVVDDDTKERLRGMKDYLLDPEQTCEVLMKILKEDTYDNGAHIDYFDFQK